MNDDLRGQYEAYPYPPRDPGDERKRLIAGSPSDLLELRHHIFAGAAPPSKPFRALVAGGGTGDATVMLAQQHASAGIESEIVHLDLAEASSAIARARIETRGLANVTFVHGTIESLPDIGLGDFDYIDCCGVLHHLVDPAAGLGILRDSLTETGGMGIMVYAPLGRTGVYHAQAMLRMIAGAPPDSGRIDIARRLLGELPATNWLRRNAHVRDHIDQGDAGLYDLLLHSRDRAYSVAELGGLLAQGNMRPVAFIDPARYDPAVYLDDPELIDRTAALHWLDRCAFAELLAGNIKTHIVYAVRADNTGDTLAKPESPKAIPVLCDGNGSDLARRLQPGKDMRVEMDGVKMRFEMPQLVREIVGRIDGARPLGAIHADIAATSHPGLDWIGFRNQFDRIYRAFYGVSRMFIRM